VEWLKVKALSSSPSTTKTNQQTYMPPNSKNHIHVSKNYIEKYIKILGRRDHKMYELLNDPLKTVTRHGSD
jgi:hypothetical protein